MSSVQAMLMLIGIKNGFQLANRAAKKDDVSVTLMCNEVEDKRSWTKEFKTYIKMYG
jgi:hypothetical protein